ncbi:MAG: hypothetical protein AAFP89_21310 [Bacteroidota bacterium]
MTTLNPNIFQHALRFSVYPLLLFLGVLFSVVDLQAQTTHYLIVGSHQTLSKAQAQKAQLVQRGYKDTEVLYPTPDTKNYRVSVYQASYREAVSIKARTLPSSMPNWILELPQPAQNYYAIQTPPNGSNFRTQEPKGPSYYLIIYSTDAYKDAVAVKDAYASAYRDAQVLPKATNGYYRVSLYQSENQGRLTQIVRARARQGKKEGWILTPDMQDDGGITQNQNKRLAPQVKANKQYHLIFGSFDNLDQALQRRDILRSSGYTDARIIYPTPSSNRYRISVYSSTNPYWVENLKKQFFSQEAWILPTSIEDISNFAKN